jgi:DNA primase
MKRHAENVVVNFDPDRAGVNAAEKSIEVFLEEGMRIRVLTLAGGLDPDEFVAEHGREAYHSALAAAPRYFHWLADQARERFDMSSAEGKVQGLRFLREPLRHISDRLERAAVAQDLASYFGIDAALVLEQTRKTTGTRPVAPTADPGFSHLPPTEILLLRCVLQSADVRGELGERIQNLLMGNQLRTSAVLHAVLQAGEPPDWQAAEARLESDDKHLLSRLLFADEEAGAREGEFELAQAEACLRRLTELSHESRVTAIKARIREAERGGKIDVVRALTSELMSLGRPLARGNAAGR